MGEAIFAVKRPDGYIIPAIGPTPGDAWKAACKHLMGRYSSGLVGKLVLEGCQIVEVKLVPKN